MNTILSGIFFDHSDYRLLSIVNDVLERSRDSDNAWRESLKPYMHPHGFQTLASSANLRIAYSVVNLLGSLESGRAKQRIQALRALRDEALTSSSSSMRRNTARVLIQIMKELVRAKGDHLSQLKLAHEFRMAATGKPRVVKAQLARHHLVEMPEEWNQLTFDDRVHDANTKGRKSPTHLILDAWIKGIRRLTVVYYDFVKVEVARELLEAARIMDVEVHVGIELTARHKDSFIKLIWEPKGFGGVDEFISFLDSAEMKAFTRKGLEVSMHRRSYVYAVLEEFNQRHRRSILREFGLDLPLLERADFERFVGTGQPSLEHLGGFIHKNALPHMRSRVEELARKLSVEEDPVLRRDLELSMETLDRLDADTFVERYLLPGDNPNLPNMNAPSSQDPELLCLSPLELLEQLRRLHPVNRITLNTVNLTQADVVELLYECKGLINHLEILNLRDLIENRFRDGEDLAELREALNKGDVITLKNILLRNIEQLCLGDLTCEAESDEVAMLKVVLMDISAFSELYVRSPLHSCIGSGSTGHTSRSFGMGFAVLETLPAHAAHECRRRVREKESLCIPITTVVHERHTYSPKSNVPGPNMFVRSVMEAVPFLRKLNRTRTVDYITEQTRLCKNGCGNIVLLGGQAETTNGFDLEQKARSDGAKRLGREYLNSRLNNWSKVLLGFLPAFLTFYLTKDWWLLAYMGAFIWFGITGIRNIIQSVMGGRGLRTISLLRWHHYVNWDRIADSLLFTGFSVPLLDWLCKSMLLQDTLGITTSTAPLALYSIMALTNGVYISTHNLFRGLPRKAAAWNFFRSVLSIPLAVVLNWAVGGLLAMGGVVAVNLVLQKWAAVISKLASDCVAGVIEGAADRGVNIGMRQWDYRGKVAQVMAIYAKLETLFPDKNVLDMMRTPKGFIKAVRERQKDSALEGLDQALMINALDLLTFWMYQPRAATALEVMLHELSSEQRQIFYRSQLVLTLERDVAQLFVDGMVGKRFSQALSFYLMRYSTYLRALDSMLHRIR